MSVVAIDTNMLLLWVVGEFDLALLSEPRKHRRLSAFNVEDYNLLLNQIAPATKLVTTPHVLTETSNLIVYGLQGTHKIEIRNHLADFTGSLLECYVPALEAAALDEFETLGLTDAAWLAVLAGLPDHERRQTQLMTDDNQLYVRASSRGFSAINFTHLRVAAGLL